MYRKIDETRNDMAFIVVQLTKTGQNKNIYNVTKLGHMPIKVYTKEPDTPCHGAIGGHGHDSCHTEMRELRQIAPHKLPPKVNGHCRDMRKMWGSYQVSYTCCKLTPQTKQI